MALLDPEQPRGPLVSRGAVGVAGRQAITSVHSATCLHRLDLELRSRRLVQHRPEKAFLKERDDLADTVLDSYMRNTSDVLRMIEVS